MDNNQNICRSCRSEQLSTFLNLGQLPIADRLLTEEELNEEELAFPLEVVFCHNCSLVQILETISPDILFRNNYPYFSSVSSSLLKHSKGNVLDLIKRRFINKDSFVVEIASNDGYLLRNYVEHNIPCLGIDPASEPAKAAINIGVPTLCTFFTKELARKLADERKKADIIHANNVLAHVADTNGFVEGIKILLKDTGVAVIEVPYVKELIDNIEFDTIYHQHLCYFSITALDFLFRQHSLYLNDLKFLSIHGGSLRLYLEKKEEVREAVKVYLRKEKELGIDSFNYYSSFAKKVANIKVDLKNLLQSLKDQGKKIAGYGAAAKGCTLMNYVGIDKKLVEYLVDKNTYKQGKYMTGMHQPILSPEQLLKDNPDYILLLPWNFTTEILTEQSEYRNRGGKFIIPIPRPQII